MIFVNDEQDSMKSNFQDGVDTLYNACVSAGQTPTDKSPSSIANAIKESDWFLRSNYSNKKWQI